MVVVDEAVDLAEWILGAHHAWAPTPGGQAPGAARPVLHRWVHLRRAGGYTGYAEAYDRLRLEASRPLDAADASRMSPGVHRVRVVYEVRSGAWRGLTLEASAGRRIVWCIPSHACKWKLGDELRVRVEITGEAELRVCTDGSLILVDPEGGLHEVDSPKQAEEFCGWWGVHLRRPTVVGLAS